MNRPTEVYVEEIRSLRESLEASEKARNEAVSRCETYRSGYDHVDAILDEYVTKNSALRRILTATAKERDEAKAVVEVAEEWEVGNVEHLELTMALFKYRGNRLPDTQRRKK